jgi:hypothetical protein
MTAPTMPPLTGAIRELLFADPDFVTACFGRLATKAPDDVTEPYAVLRTSATPVGANTVAWRGTAQINGCCGFPVADTDPEDVAWNIAAHAARIFGRARNVSWQNVTYSSRVETGPIPGVPDKTRGDGAPIYWVFVRADLSIHLR